MAKFTAVKTEPTFYTYEMRQIARENIEKYDWARKIRDDAVARAEAYLDFVDVYYDLMEYEGVPRSRQVGYVGDAIHGVCRYCGVDVHGKYGGDGVGGFVIDPVNHPWKVQCLECKRWFPTNDFASFYKLGLDENDRFNYDKAWEENDKLIASGHPGYLVNELYPEMGEGWGVDDGYGARVYKDGAPYHKFISKDPNLEMGKSAVYVALWWCQFWDRLWKMTSVFSNAYLFTGDLRYARAGAKLIDRIADVIQSYNFRNYGNTDFLVTCGGTGYGIFIGRIFDPYFVAELAKAADAYFPVLNDGELVAYLSEKAKKFGLANDKSSGAKIWQNWRDQIFAPVLQMAEDGRLKGNYGIAENCVATNALVLGEEPLSGEMMAWIYKADTSTDRVTATGGNFNAQVINVVDRDGFGNEASPQYNSGWVNNLCTIAEKMARYEGEKNYNPYEHPKFVQMFLNYDELMQSDNYTVQIGDAGAVADVGFLSRITNACLSAWKNLKDTPVAKKLAQYIYITCRGKLDDLHYDIFTKNPESVKDELMALVDEQAPKESAMLPGYGYATLKDGFTNDRESLRSVWTYFGLNHYHGHQDTLHLGMDAFGLNIAPETGYPAATINDPTNAGFTRTTVAHNTVSVDKLSQYWHKRVADPYIFDSSDRVKVMGVEANDAYYFGDAHQASYLKETGMEARYLKSTQPHRLTDSYNRAVMMVKVDAVNSYYVDFFRVLGGDNHTYSFHSQSHQATPVSGLNLVKQVDENGNYVGTYAGAEIPKGGEGQFPLGYNYFTKVRQDKAPESNRFCVDFAVMDYRKVLGENGKGIHLKMTQINNFVPDEVAIVGGHVNIKTTNKAILEQTDTLDYVLTQRESKNGEKLDSLFTTVFEPYRNEAYLQDIEELPVTVVKGTPKDTDVVKALLITHKNGRKDYVFYATNKEITYCVDNLFNVRGYMGIYSVGQKPFRYVVGGNVIGETIDKVGVYKGTVQNFSTDLSLYNNFIDVDIVSTAAEELAGKFVYIENDGQQNGVYEIVSAEPIEGGVRLNIGTVSLIRSMKDVLDNEAGYIYNVAKGQKIEIPMSFVQV